MKRRTALELIAAGIAPGQVGIAQHHLVTLAQASESYQLQFFSPAQNEMLATLTEMIIPADDHSPGAREAKVNLFIDLMVAHSSQNVQEQWRSGLKLVEAEAQTRVGKPFLKCSAAEENNILAVMAASEAEPNSELEQFFGRLKSMTVDGYYTSATGIHRELQYKGNAVLTDFPGCRHAEH